MLTWNNGITKMIESIQKNPELITELIKGMKAEKTSLKFSYEKILRSISERAPQLIYPYFEDLANLLDNENNFIKWGVIITISNLVIIDDGNKFIKLFEKYYSPVKGPTMITAANIIKSSWKLAIAKPELADRIACEILKVRSARYINHGQTSPECKNIACGHAIDSFSLFFDKIENKTPVFVFIKKQLKNSRPAVAKKAKKFLKKFERFKN
jgi:hypothetical protein